MSPLARAPRARPRAHARYVRHCIGPRKRFFWHLVPCPPLWLSALERPYPRAHALDVHHCIGPRKRFSRVLVPCPPLCCLPLMCTTPKPTTRSDAHDPSSQFSIGGGQVESSARSATKSELHNLRRRRIEVRALSSIGERVERLSCALAQFSCHRLGRVLLGGIVRASSCTLTTLPRL